MNRQLPLTPAEVERFKALAVGESMWLVRDGIVYPVLRPSVSPPAVFVQACAPCETCEGSRCVVNMLGYGLLAMEKPCPDCRIELVDAKPCCGADDGYCFRGDCSRRDGTVTLGYAYAVGQPLPIIAFGDWLRDETILPRCAVVADGNIYIRGVGFPVPNITDRLAHYGPPETLVGRWALELAEETP